MCSSVRNCGEAFALQHLLLKSYDWGSLKSAAVKEINCFYDSYGRKVETPKILSSSFFWGLLWPQKNVRYLDWERSFLKTLEADNFPPILFCSYFWDEEGEEGAKGNFLREAKRTSAESCVLAQLWSLP